MAPGLSKPAWQWWLEGNEKGRYQVAECRRAVQRRHAHQPYSWIRLGDSWVVVMWDTGCSLPGLITLTKFEEWKERFGIRLKHEKWYDKGKEISSVSADNPVMMVGTVVFEFSHEGRSLDLEFGVLKGGDTGSADVMMGNYVLRSDKYDGAIDVGAGVVALRKVASRGMVKIPVTTELAGLASMLSAHMAHDEIDRDRAADKGETVPAAFDANKGRMILNEEFFTLLPGEARWCHVKLQDEAVAVMDG